MDKKTKIEILKLYDNWLYSYLNGDVETYDSYFDDAFHFIGSTNNEEFLNRKDTTQFFKDTAEQFSGKTELRNEIKTVEAFDDLIFITHVFDAWFLNNTEWTYYSRFRFSSVLQEKKEGWRFIYQHFSIADNKTDEGESIGFDKVNAENQELREAIKRRTVELESKNRELKIEGALERIRAQAVAMQQSSDLLDIVVTMRKEFIKLGHEAHYFWHMMWLEDKYEKAMTSGDGTRIGFVMELPRHIHVDIPLLSNWENSDDATVIYPMNAKAAINYVDKMITLGDFQNIDPQAPSHDDIRHIGGLTFIMARTTHGEIGYSLPGIVKSPPAEDLDILIQFAGAFDLAHRRFLDLQKAENQAHEVQIELALEKVRSRTMSMQRSEELTDVATVLFKQVKSLGIEQWSCGFNIWETGDKEFMFYPGSTDEIDFAPCKVPLTEHPVFMRFDESRQRGDELLIFEKEGKEQEDHYKYMLTHTGGLGKMLQEMLDAGHQFPPFQIDHIVNFSHGNLLFITYEPVPKMHEVFIRFAKVFEQTYTRFLDLQKAEAQTKEAKNEAALERVRSRSMAMHKSDELKEVVKVIFDQMTHLKITADHVGIVVDFEPKKDFHFWVADNQDIPARITVPYLDLVWDRQFTEAKKKGKDFFTTQLDFEEKNSFYKKLLPHIEGLTKQAKDFYLNCPGLSASTVLQKDIGLYIENFSGTPFSDDENNILMRFGKVFQQTYTRFLDLQKAEAQAREAQINLAVERVRAKALAMHKSEEIMEVVAKLKEEVMALDIPDVIAATIFLKEDEDKVRMWDLSTLEKDSNGYQIPFDITFKLKKSDPHLYVKRIWENPENFFIEVQDAKDFKRIIAWLRENNKDEIANEVEDYIESAQLKRLYHAVKKLNKGKLAVDLLNTPSDEMETILTKMGAAFDLAYKRFEDLQKAESQTREAQIESALEKVRSRTMAMQHSDELPEAANNLFLQVQELGIPAWSAGYCIWEENQKSALCHMSSEGEIQKAFSLPTIGEGYNFYDPYKKGETFHVSECGGKNLVKHYDFMKTLPTVGAILEELVKAGLSLPTFQIFHVVFLKFGYVMFITYEAVPDSHHIFKRFGQVFEQTYTRFLDLKLKEDQAVKLEEEKQRLEKTLKDLQQTQKQLIQSEKMASLGELTAGIAHEIQNPLNFVNNFSEVSKELLDEMLEEMQKGDVEEVKAISDDLIQNLEKINHHGKRADGIVKGMLQHSRVSGDKKEPTDINTLADEYLRLAYHGLRAKDKTFNATMKTDFDETIKSIDVIPQDMGRVILNLLTNAFYAVNEKIRELNEGYEPTVSISTKKDKHSVEIKVADNGNGMPDVVKEKIFQPFFTTKPTGQGTGLGLSMSYDIITKGHGGELKVETKKGEGTEFIIHLPSNN